MSYTIKQLSEPGLAIHMYRTLEMMMGRIRSTAGSLNDAAYVSYLFYKLLCSGEKNLNLPFSREESAKKQWARFTSGEIKLDPIVYSVINSGTVKDSFIRAYGVYDSVGDNADTFAYIVVYYDDYAIKRLGKSFGEFSTPRGLIKLAQSALKIEAKDKVADVCCGYGNFLIKSIIDKPKAQYSGYEINLNCAAFLAMKADILGVAPAVKVGDIEDSLAKETEKYDKIFSNYPLGLRLDRYDEIAQKLPFHIGRYDSDWYFNNVIIEHLTDDGKAFVITGNGAAWNQSSKEARKYFVDNGYIEAIINLPANLLAHTSIALSAYILSKNNKSIRMVNAEDLVDDSYSSISELSDEHIAEMLKMLNADSEKSIVVSPDEVAAHDYSLAFRAYKSGLAKFKNATRLAEVATITRGVMNLKNDSTKENTGAYLLQLSDLESGTIKADLSNNQFVRAGADESLKLMPYDIVISRSAEPVKMAIVSPDESRTLYPNGNMFVIRAKNVVNPYFLLSFLMSRDGQEALAFATTGNVLKTISTNSLSELVFPLEKPKKQREVAERIKEAMMQYELYTHRVAAAEERIANSFYGEEA